MVVGKEQIRKAVTVIAMVVLAFISAMTFAPVAYAEDDTDGTDTEYVTKGVLAWVLNGELNGLNGTSTMAQNITKNAFLGEGSVARTAWDTAQGMLKNVYDVIFALGLSLSVAYFLVYLMHEMAEQRWTPDSLIRAGVILVASSYIMAKGFDLLSDFIDIGTALGTQLNGQLTAADVPTAFVDTEFVDRMNTGNILTQLGGIVTLLIPWIASQALYVYLYMVCFSRMIELFVRVVFAPLALGNLYSGGPNPTALRYLRGFLAVCLQGAAIVVALYIFRILSSAVGTAQKDFGIGFFGNIVMLAACAGFIGRSQSFCKELCGVG